MTEDKRDNILTLRETRNPFNTSLAEAFTQVGKAGLAAVLAHFQSQLGLPPGTDGAAVAVFDAFTRPLLTNRYEDFATSVIERLILLEQQNEGFKSQSLIDDEQFTTVVMQASLSAAVTHQEEKRAALRNAVLNTALGTSLSEDAQLIFLQLVNRLTPTHLKVLEFFRDPRVGGLATGWRNRPGQYQDLRPGIQWKLSCLAL